MLENLLRPWILARLATGLAAAVLCAVGVVVALRVLRHWRVGALSEGQLHLERRAELVATLVQVALVFGIVGLGLLVVGADRTSAEIRGAMCAWGVLASTDTGFLALATSGAAAAACALWLVLHRLDLRLPTPVLTKRKFTALLWVAPIVWIDLVATAAFALELDLSVVASCCSVSLDHGVAEATGGAAGGPRLLAAGVAGVAGLGAIGAALWARRKPIAAAAWTATALSLVAAAAAVPAILWYVAPHAYETPTHLCPFCLLHGDVYGIGWPLFAALFAGTVLGSGLGIVEASKRASGAPDEAAAMQRTLGRWTAIAWVAVLVLSAIPVVRFAIVSGGASLWG